MHQREERLSPSCHSVLPGCRNYRLVSGKIGHLLQIAWCDHLACDSGHEALRYVRLFHESKAQLHARNTLTEGHDGYPVFIERVDGRGAVRFHATLGQRESPHATGAGKVILAQLDDVDVQRVLNEAGLPRHTPSTITSIEEFHQELDRVRLVGFGVDNEEESEGIVCVGAPIFDHQHHCAGAISLTGLKADMGDGDVGRLGALVRDYAERVTKILSGGR